jgi:type II secretory pathway pseudopilin PulG
MKPAQAVHHLPDTLPKPRGRRWLLWLGVPLVLGILWLVFLYAFFAYWMDRELRAAMAVADRDSPGGWKLKDIEAHRQQIPDAENAALIAMRVKNLMPADWPLEIASSNPEPGPVWTMRLGELSPEVQLDAALLGRLRESLARVEPARAEAGKLIGMTRGRFPIQWDENVVLTTLNSGAARTTANLLHDEAIVASQDGDADRALALVRGMLGAARAVGDEPLLISALIRIACDVQAVQTLERALAQGEPSRRELEALQSLLEKEAAEPIFLRAVRGERASMHELLLSMRHGGATLSELEWSGTGPRPRKHFLDNLGPTLARYSHAHVLQLMNQFVDAAKLPPEQQPPVMTKLQQKVKKAKAEWDIVTALVMPGMQRISNANSRNVGNLRCALVAMSLERYRRDHNRWPETLNALVPKYLAAVPTDPQDGQPLRFKRRPDGVIVYWIGLDGTDDGGKLTRGNPWIPGSDQGFQLWNVQQRRQPAREMLPQPAEEPAK